MRILALWNESSGTVLPQDYDMRLFKKELKHTLQGHPAAVNDTNSSDMASKPNGICVTHEKMENKTSDRTNTEVLERDTWGYAVCFGTIITFIAGIGHINSFGLVYNDFITDTRSTTKSLTTAHGVFAIMLAVGGILLNVMSKRFSLRSSGILGAALFSIGAFATIFISNTNQLPLTFGVLQGIGFGVMVPVCYSTLNLYFVKKRTTVMSICKSMQGLVMMWYPQLLKATMSFYGFRQSLLIIAGISLHTFPGMLLMKGVEGISKKPRTASNIEDGKEERENVDLLNNDNIIDINNSEEKTYKEICKKMRYVISETFSLNVLKDPVYCNICIGQSFVNFSDLSFFILQPMLLFQFGYDKTQVATCISVCAGADVAGRCSLVIISSIMSVNTRLLFFLSTLFTLLIRILILQVRDFVWVAILTACLGVLRAWLHISSPLVISNHVSAVEFPGAYALSALAAGLVNVTISPFIGLLKDVYQDYMPAFYALTVCCLPCLLLWPIEYILRIRKTTVPKTQTSI